MTSNPDIIITCGFQTIFYEAVQNNKKGMTLANCGHVINCTEVIINDGISFIKSLVIRQASVSNPPYEVKLEVSKSLKLYYCPAGAGKKCKHIAALVHYINQEDVKSKTDFEKQWGKPSKAGEEKYKKGKTISELFIPKKKFKANDLQEINHIELVSNYNILDIPCSFTKLLSVETKTELERECESCVKGLVDQTEINELYSRHGPSLDFILVRQKLMNFSNFNNFYKFPLNINEYNYYLNNIVVNDNKMIKIFIQTIKQSESKTWVEQRQKRISATKTHQVINTRMSYQKVANILMSNSVLKGKASINVCYGLMTEKIAIESYLKTYTECDYIECGLVIHTEYPWLCASPDGLIIKNGKVDRVLEIKCPISCTNTPIETDRKLNLSYLKYDSYGKV
ncbi:SWIM-type domain-containing protein [Aphis craccivora]|uniref:SWIM-type domain-containing protein n=1 Tax=Aphis craccivora TaxID=307492 RepID=A0A6G0VYX7_APHCR|nr:SWIM-type domain-containing protein [Aphis craccivora]